MSEDIEKLDRRVAQAFYGRFIELRPLQKAVIGPLMEGKNVVVSSATGSGKTEAVVAPLLSRYWLDAVKDGRTFLLYISPTKALINDIAVRLRPRIEALGLRAAIRHGDRDELSQAQKAHLLITTPESLNVLMVKKEPALAEIKCVVIDEVHQLYNTQRGLQLAVLLHRLRILAGGQLQWAALSATIGRLEDISRFLFGVSEHATFLSFPAARSIDAQIRITATNRAIRQLFVRLLDVPRRKLLTFANSRRLCEQIAEVLDADPALKGAVFTHYSSLAPATREATEQQFATAPRAVCVATSTLEMGIDIGDIDAVVLYGVPYGIESFLQRIGRGNRRTNKTNAICLVSDGPTAEREAMLFSAMVGLAREGRLPARRPEQLYGAVAQQCLSIIQERDGGFTRIVDLSSQVAFSDHLGRNAVEAILAELASHELIQKHGFKNQYGAKEGLWELCDQGIIWGNYPLGSQTIDLFHGQHILGSIPRANLVRLRRDNTFRFGGRRWRIREIDSASIQVEPTTSKAIGVEITYGGRGQTGLDTFTSRQLWNALFLLTEERSAMDHDTWSRVAPKLATIRSVCTVNSLPWARTPAGIRYYTFGGLELNQVLVDLVSGANAVDTWIETPKAVNWGTLELDRQKLLPHARAVFTASDKQTYYQQMLPTLLQTDEWLESWLKDDDVNDALGALSKAELVEVQSSLLSFLDPE